MKPKLVLSIAIFLLFPVFLFIGCSSSAEVERLRRQIEELEESQPAVEEAAEEAVAEEEETEEEYEEEAPSEQVETEEKETVSEPELVFDTRDEWVGTYKGKCNEERGGGSIKLFDLYFTLTISKDNTFDASRWNSTDNSLKIKMKLPNNPNEIPKFNITNDTISLKPTERYPYEIFIEKAIGPFGEDEIIQGKIIRYKIQTDGSATISSAVPEFSATIQ